LGGPRIIRGTAQPVAALVTLVQENRAATRRREE